MGTEEATMTILDVRALNQTLQPLFWAAFGAILVSAIVVPVLGSVGKVVAGKIEKKWGD